jgi:hypothetical protein
LAGAPALETDALALDVAGADSGGTLALGGLILGAINVVSMGFAAILLGLAVDYAVVHYQEALAYPLFPCRKSAAPSRRASFGRP